jgi:hypothetical protein
MRSVTTEKGPLLGTSYPQKNIACHEAAHLHGELRIRRSTKMSKKLLKRANTTYGHAFDRNLEFHSILSQEH